MESLRQDEASDEDIPSDFFDDFNKDEFIEGLNVIDSWDVEEGVSRLDSRSRINSATVDGVQDLRELIRDGKDDKLVLMHREKYDSKCKKSRYEFDAPYERQSSDNRRDSSSSRIDNYIKPGSRRDLRKTNEAIRKDKQVKVKEYLSKHLDSIDDLKPPGTELDDFLNEPSTTSKRKYKSRSPDEQYIGYQSKESKYRISPRRRYQYRERHSPQHSSRENYYNHHHHNSHYSPPHRVRYHSPSWRPRRHYNPHFSLRRRNSKPCRSSLQRSPSSHSLSRHSRGGSRTPTKYEKHSPVEHKDTFLYPNDTPQSSVQPSVGPNPVVYQSNKRDFYLNSTLTEYPPRAQGYSYVQNTPYSCTPYNYQGQADLINSTMVQSLSIPVVNSGPMDSPSLDSASAVALAPISSNIPAPQDKQFDALAKLLIEGKISKEDYLKLTPNKGTFMDKPVDAHVKAKVLNRCLEALTKLSKLELPNRLLIKSDLIGQETKSLTPRYCSPLKRHAMLEFNFTKTNGKTDTVQKNSQVIDSIISSIGLPELVARSKKLNRKDVKDAAVQTTKPFCEVCLIRGSTKTTEAGTSTDVEHFTSTVHTQVVELDLMSSKSVFTPSGCVTDNAPISIAHLTPAQLVSQLAARAKTLKQSNSGQRGQYNKQNPGNYYAGGSKDDKFYTPYH